MPKAIPCLTPAVAMAILMCLVTCPLDTSYAALSTSTSSVMLTVGATQNFTISGGTGFYKITSSDTSIATASISGSAGDQGTIKGVAIGTATITIEDSSATTTTIAVTVSQITLGKNSVALAPGGTDTVTILTGSTYYNVTSSDDAVATASVYNDTVTIVAVGSGSCTVTVTDSNSDTALIAVTVGSSFSVSPSSLTLSIGETATATLSDSTGFYNASTSSSAVATVILSGSTVSVTGVAAGSATVTVINSVGFTATIDVTVDVSLYDSVSLGISESTTFSLAGGSGYYNVDIANDAVASVSLLGDDLTITGAAAGKTTVTVEDNQDNKVVFDVSVRLAAPVLTYSVNNTLVNLSWDPVANADSHILYYAPANAAGSVNTAKISKINVGSLGALLFNLESGDHYFLALQAVNETYPAVSSLASNIVEIKIP